MSETLALYGGDPVCTEKLTEPAWPCISETTAQRLREVYLSGQWSFNSPAEQEFEKTFADYHGARHGIFMVNGTVTLQAALSVCGIGQGDEVIVPALTWLATAMAVHYVGATPVFVDVEPTTLCMDPEKVQAAVTPRTRAMIPVHLYGSMADLEALQTIANENHLTLIEDCAHMHGGKWNGKGVGSWGKIGSFSFQQTKTLASGEGGICLTNDDELADKLFCYKQIGYHRGQTQGSAKQGPPDGLVCRNYRGNAFHATILLDQLVDLNARIEMYNQNAGRLAKRLQNVRGVRIQSPGRLANPQGYYAWFVIFDEERMATVPRERILQAAEAEGLPLLKTYGPVYKHILYNMPPSTYRIAEPCRVTDTIVVDQTFGLLHPWLGAEENAIAAIGDILAKIASNAETLATTDPKAGR